ncbi:MAG: hypothetical protein DRQ40_03860 [Gammaproteobacteria bacterium]|nr:MAG: hypothetical protein DRQ40_03860 [Gammaproteobacteria bacterium]
MIIRSKRRTDYTIIPNQVINDDNLGWKDLGLLCYLLSKPDHWQISISHLVKQRNAGEAAVRIMINNLRKSGYITMHRRSSGRTDWLVYDAPQEKPHSDNRDKAQKPHREKPHVEKPHVDNRHTIVSTDPLVSTDLVVSTETQQPQFLDFYKRYPRKLAKKQAQAAWTKLKPKDKQLACEQLDQFLQGKEIKYLPYPATYLNGNRWEDEPANNTTAPLGSFLDNNDGAVVINSTAQRVAT